MYELFSVVPRPLTAAMMARLMPAAINPYSIAVAADWSAKNLEISTSFIDGGLFETTAIIADALPFDPYEAQRAEFLRRWLNIHRQEVK